MRPNVLLDLLLCCFIWMLENLVRSTLVKLGISYLFSTPLYYT